MFSSSAITATSTLVAFTSASGNDSWLSVGWKKEVEGAEITDAGCYLH